jgi:hypothetical protein
MGSLLEAPGSQAAEGFVTGSERQGSAERDHVHLIQLWSPRQGRHRRDGQHDPCGQQRFTVLSWLPPFIVQGTRWAPVDRPEPAAALGRVTDHSERFLQEAQARGLWDSFAPVQTLVWARGAHWSGSKVLATRARVGVSTHACASPAPWPVSPRSRYYWADEEPAARADAAQSSRRELIPSFM